MNSKKGLLELQGRGDRMESPLAAFAVPFILALAVALFFVAAEIFKRFL
ncbi:MAG TPA: hypothetical protein VM163_06380 [bacterium]|nr:hypothetical protein [bacterium]